MQFVSLCLVVAACGTTNSTMIPVIVPGQPALMTLKIGTSGWNALAGTYDVNANSTAYQLEVTDEFELVGGCTRADGTFWLSEVFGTFDDATVTLGSWAVPDCVKGTNGLIPPPATAMVTFTASSDVDASLDFDISGHSLQAGMPHSFSTWQGLHDLIAVDPTNNNILVRHEVEIDDGTDVGTLPLGAESEAMLTSAYAYDAQPDEGVTIVTYLLTAHGALREWNQPDDTTALFVPPAQLHPGDLQRFEFSITAPPVTRRGALANNFDRTVPDFDLLPRLAAVTSQPGELGATWVPFPDFYTSVLVDLYDARGSRLYVAKSKLWLERHGTSTIDFDTDVDGYEPRWMLPSPGIMLQAQRWSEAVMLYSSFTIAPH